MANRFLIFIFLSVHEAVVQNNIPAVFLEGTGRCCAIFAKALRLYKEYRQKFEESDDPLRYKVSIDLLFFWKLFLFDQYNFHILIRFY